MKVYLRKIISITLIMTLLINSNEPLFAQTTPSLPKDLQSINSDGNEWNDIFANISGSINEAAQRKAELKETFKNLYYRYDGSTLKEILQDIEKQVIEIKSELLKEQEASLEESIVLLGNLYNKEVCIDLNKYEETGNKVCATYAEMISSVIGGWISSDKRDEFEVMKSAGFLTEPVGMGLVEAKDAAKIRQYLWGEIKGINNFEISNRKETEAEKELRRDYKHGLDYYISKCNVEKEKPQDKDRCEIGLKAASLLVAVSSGEKKEAEEAADYVYENILKKSIKGRPYSGMLLPYGIGLLSAIDSEYSYDLIEEFLMRYSIPGRTRETLTNYQLGLGFNGLYQMGEDATKIGKAERYLNAYNKRWQYIDREYTEKKLGVKYEIRKETKWTDMGLVRREGRYKEEEELFFESKPGDKLWNEYNLAFGNILTDIGKYLPTQGERGQALSKKIVNAYVSGKEVHKPLVLGLIQGLGDERAAANFMQDTFYIDINGGTGRWILDNIKAGSGSVKIWQNTYSLDYYRTKGKISTVLDEADIVLSVIFMALMVVSLPKIISDLYRIGRVIRYGKLKTLVKVSRNVRNIANASEVSAGINKAAAAKAKAPAQVSGNVETIGAELPKPGAIQPETVTLTATVGEGGGGALSNGSAISKFRTKGVGGKGS